MGFASTALFGVWEPSAMTSPDVTREELIESIATLRNEVARLKEEIRLVRRENSETPPHYL